MILSFFPSLSSVLSGYVVPPLPCGGVVPPPLSDDEDHDGNERQSVRLPCQRRLGFVVIRDRHRSFVDAAFCFPPAVKLVVELFVPDAPPPPDAPEQRCTHPNSPPPRRHHIANISHGRASVLPLRCFSRGRREPVANDPATVHRSPSKLRPPAAPSHPVAAKGGTPGTLLSSLLTTTTMQKTMASSSPVSASSVAAAVAAADLRQWLVVVSPTPLSVPIADLRQPLPCCSCPGRPSPSTLPSMVGCCFLRPPSSIPTEPPS